NNPISEGTVFKELAYKKLPPLSTYKFLVCYTDPSFKESKKNDFKATVLVGRWKDEYHVIKAFVDQTSTANMINWHYEIAGLTGVKVPVYYYMESNFIQDTLLGDFFKPAQDEKKAVVPVRGHDRKKPELFSMLASLLAPLNRNG